MAKALDNNVGREFGKAMCDRLGLPHGIVLRDWEATSETKEGPVVVTMKVIKVMPAEEYNELWDVARRRAQA